jgi:CPA2 family monovalent cation:H+ antiporter-2
MLVDPEILMKYAVPILALVLTILVGQSIFGSLSFLLGGESLRSAMRCGFSMAQIGKFSFIIASLGLSQGVISGFLYPVVVAVSVITTFLTPYMIRLSTPAYNNLEKHLPKSLIKSLNNMSMSQPATTKQSLWKRLLRQMFVNTLVYSILTTAATMLMLTFFLPFARKLLEAWEEDWYANALTGVLTIVLISPFLRAMIMKKNRSEEFKALWDESNYNRPGLLFTILVRVIIALAFIFYIFHYLSHLTNAIIMTIGLVAIVVMVFSRTIKSRSIRLERLFIMNLRSRDIQAQVSGKKRPLYEGRLLDRNVHIADFEVPMNTLWMGSTLRQQNFGQKYGVHISSILRAGNRLNIPDGNYMIFPGDRLQVIGSDEQLIKFRNAIETDVIGEDLEMERREMKLHQLIISKDCPFVGKTLEESGLRNNYNCMLVGLEEGKENLSSFSPKRKFKEGDIIWVVGEEEDLKLLAQIQH